jgi:hypothetical protein
MTRENDNKYNKFSKRNITNSQKKYNKFSKEKDTSFITNSQERTTINITKSQKITNSKILFLSVSLYVCLNKPQYFIHNL